ncbi:hypothetical protein N9359_04460 [Luminiphilus sp.]|nr:hypothetical protein [Luminiphilus sp.]
MTNVLDRKPQPRKGVPDCYFEHAGWVDLELADLHVVAATSLAADYDPENATSVYHAAGRYYRAAVLSLIFRALDSEVPPSHRQIAELLNANEVPKRRKGQPWNKDTVRNLFIRCGVLEDFLSYRNSANGLFIQWFEGEDSKVRWCRGPSTLKDSK